MHRFLFVLILDIPLLWRIIILIIDNRINPSPSASIVSLLSFSNVISVQTYMLGFDLSMVWFMTHFIIMIGKNYGDDHDPWTTKGENEMLPNYANGSVSSYYCSSCAAVTRTSLQRDPHVIHWLTKSEQKRNSHSIYSQL